MKGETTDCIGPFAEKSPGKNKNISSSDRFPLQPQGENNKTYIYIYYIYIDIHFSKWAYRPTNEAAILEVSGGC